MIAATEIQVAAESAKQVTRSTLYSYYNGNLAQELQIEPLQDQETWVTQGDSLVRDGDGTRFNHLAADGQEKKNGVYIVSGESLRFPGDISLGASLGNTIRCRCSSVTSIS